MNKNFSAMAALLRGEGHEYAPFQDLKQGEVVKTGDELTETIFAPDPFTGVPRSDIALMMSKDTRPEVAQYIRDALQQPRQSISTDDPDFALSTIKDRRESLQEYADRLRSLFQPDKISE